MATKRDHNGRVTLNESARKKLSIVSWSFVRNTEIVCYHTSGIHLNASKIHAQKSLFILKNFAQKTFGAQAGD